MCFIVHLFGSLIGETLIALHVFFSVFYLHVFLFLFFFFMLMTSSFTCLSERNL